MRNRPIKLKSGRMSPYDIDIRNAMTNVADLIALCKYIYAYCMEHGLKPDYFLGVPETCTPMAVILNTLIDYKKLNAVPLNIIRSAPKTYQDKSTWHSVNPFMIRGNKCILIEDDVTTGNTLIKTIKLLKSKKVQLLGVITISNRLEVRDDGLSVSAYVNKKMKTNFSYMTDSKSILKSFLKKHSELSDSQVQKIHAYLSDNSLIKL